MPYRGQAPGPPAGLFWSYVLVASLSLVNFSVERFFFNENGLAFKRFENSVNGIFGENVPNEITLAQKPH